MKNNLPEKLKTINKSYYTFSDLLKISSLKKESLKVALFRLAKEKKILRLRRNIYILPEKTGELEKIANQIYGHSYLSFESALSLWGILSQIPYVIIFATLNKSKKFSLAGKTVEYRHLKKELFFGYFLKDGLYVAYPEKALLDTFYIASFGKLKINFKTLDYSKINRKKFLGWLKKYPPKTQKFALLTTRLFL